MHFTNIKVFFRKYKKPLVILGLIFIFILLSALLTKGQDEQTHLVTPIIVDQQTEETTTGEPKGVLNLVEVYPPSGGTSTVDKFAVLVFRFDSDIAADNISVYSDPYIDLTTEIRGNILFLSPKYTPWENLVSYKIKITGVVSLDGKRKAEGITYIYSNEEPIIMEGGESGWLKKADR